MFRGGDGGAGCLYCGRAVGPRLGAVQSGTGFPGLAAASKKFPVEHSPAGAGVAGAAVDLGGMAREFIKKRKDKNSKGLGAQWTGKCT